MQVNNVIKSYEVFRAILEIRKFSRDVGYISLVWCKDFWMAYKICWLHAKL